MTFARFAQISEDVARGESRNVTLRDLADLSGFSTDKLWRLRAYLNAFQSPGGAKCGHFVTHADAVRFLRELRLIP